MGLPELSPGGPVRSRHYITTPISRLSNAPRERGQGLVEYALILVLVAVVVIVILALLGPAIANVFSNIVTNI